TTTGELELQIQRCAKIIDHRRQGLERADDARQQFAGAGECIRERFAGGEIPAFEVLDQLVLWIVAARRAAQVLAEKFEAFAKCLAARGFLPRCRVFRQKIADALERGRLRVPDAAANETIVRLDV